MNKEVSNKVIGGHFGQISAIDIADLTVVRSHRLAPTESQMDLERVAQQLDRCFSYHTPLKKKPADRIATKKKTLPQVLHFLAARRVRFSFQRIQQFVIYSESDEWQKPVYEQAVQTFSDAVSNLQSVLTCYQQKQKVYAFIRIKMLADSRNTFREHSFLGQEYLMLKLQALEASITRVFENSRRAALKQFFEEIERHNEEQLRKEQEQKLKREEEHRVESLRQNSKSATMIGPTSITSNGQGKQIIYFISNSHGRHRTEASNPVTPNKAATTKQPTFVRIPLYSDQVELNEIHINQGKGERQSRFNASTVHKQRRRKVDYDATQLVEHGRGQCTKCRFCRQQDQLKSIERESQERRASQKRRSSLTITGQVLKNRRLVHLN